MATGLAAATANSMLDALCNATSWSIANTYIKLHIGDPGSAGASNPATETTRQGPISWGSASGGAVSNDTAIQWTSIAGSEDATHFSLWDASTAGTFLASGTLTANAYTAGDTLTIAIGDLDLDLTPIAA